MKTKSVKDVAAVPKYVLGGSWKPQEERMASGIYFSLYLVLKSEIDGSSAVYFLPKDLQAQSMFEARKPLSNTAKRAGWTGYRINVSLYADKLVRLL